MRDQELIARLRHEQNKQGWCEQTLDEQVACALINALSAHRANPKRVERREVDKILNRWGNAYFVHDYREACRSTGNAGGSALGRDVKRNNKENNIYAETPSELPDDTEYAKVNHVVLKMSPGHRAVIMRHYVERKEWERKTCDRLGDALTDRDTSVKAWIEHLGVNESEYRHDLGNAKDEFFIRW